MRPRDFLWTAVALGCLLLSGAAGPSYADTAASDGQPTQEVCLAAVAEATRLAAALPADDLSRYFAERDLQQAMIEAGNGEFDDCLEWAAHATQEVREHRHALPPGEKLNVRHPAE